MCGIGGVTLVQAYPIGFGALRASVRPQIFHFCAWASPPRRHLSIAAVKPGAEVLRDALGLNPSGASLAESAAA